MIDKKESGNEQEAKVTSIEVEKVFNLLANEESIKQALSYIQTENDNTTKDQIEVTEIPAPTYLEKERGEYYKERLISLGLEDVTVDEVGNVFGKRPGKGDGPTLVVCSHLDTVFPEHTDTKVVYKDGKIYAPGISDNGRGLAVVLTLIKTLNHIGLETEGDIVFGATVGEEGLGDLCGVKALFKEREDLDGFISVEPGDPSSTIFLGTGSHRYHVTYKGPGGHSFMAFGLPSAIHAMGRAIAFISDIQTPSDPKTTFTIGMVDGGTSVNTIAQEASMLVDIRSTSKEELLSLEEKIVAFIHQAVKDENDRWNTDSISVDLKLVGDRPAGVQSPDTAIVQSSLAASKVLGSTPTLAPSSSTDSNVPISLGIPAVTLGGGGESGGIHTLDEYFDPTDAYQGVQKIFLTMIGLVGVSGVSEPLL
ncbi:M20/M25/M40 family metallo-hydrolase [Evansella sp. AB-rgal1]|uniref:M20/M25/M40 family metallo-hydrolase n=1 Tax=Evansella sp. AB-rgal1 TaxID=3242696 RepID=UPI00359DDFCD